MDVSVQREVQIKIDSDNENEVYVGEAPVGALPEESRWKIKRILISSNQTSVQWARGFVDFVNKWTDRKTYEYK